MSEACINHAVQVDCEISKHKWTLSDDEWHYHAEFEGILHITQIASTRAQYERLLLGAYSSMIKSVTLKNLRQDKIPVVKYEEMTDRATLVRAPKDVAHFTRIGRGCLDRARLEGRRRFCGNKTAFVQGESLPVSHSDSELIATPLDIGTVHCKQLTKDKRQKAVEIFETEHVKYFRTAEMFESNSAEKCGVPVAERKDKNSQETLPSMASASSKMLLRGFTNSSYMSTGGDNTWSDSKDEDTTRSQLSTVEIKAIDKKACKNFRKVVIDWRKEYPEEKLTPCPANLYILKDLMRLNPGKIYKKLDFSDPERIS